MKRLGLLAAVLVLATVASADVLHPPGGGPAIEGVPIRAEFGGTGVNGETQWTAGRCLETFIDTDFKIKVKTVAASCGTGGGSAAFSALTAGTNTTAAMVVGSGASLSVTGTGTIGATDLVCSQCIAPGELSNNDYGDFSCTGGTCTADANSIALGTDTTGSYAAGDAEAGNATGVACTDCIALTTETTGNYVASVTEGTALDCTGTGEGAGVSCSLDTTEINDTTFGNNTDAGLTFTFDPTGSNNPTIVASSGKLAMNGENVEFKDSPISMIDSTGANGVGFDPATFIFGVVGTGQNIATDTVCTACLSATELAANSVATSELTDTITAGSCTSCNLTYDVDGRITVAASGGGGFDSTLVNDTTWGNNADATMVWTFDPSGANSTMEFSSAGINFPSDTIGFTGSTVFITDVSSNGVFFSGSTLAAAGTGLNQANDVVCTGCVGTTDIATASNFTWTGDQSMGKAMLWPSDLTPPQITADQNNYAPTNLANNIILRLDTDATRTLTGLAGGSDGRIIEIVNVGANSLILSNQNAASSSTNRFLFGADITLAPEQAILLIFDATTGRWRPLARASVSLAGADVTGTLPVANGGTNLTAATDDNAMVGNGTTWQSKALADSDGAGQVLQYDTTGNAFAAHTLVDADVPNTITVDLATSASDLTCTNCIGATEITDLALGTDTSGNYALGDAEGGAATTGDSATAFFSAGTLEVNRGGTGTSSTLTGLIRGSVSAMTAAELSGDVVTSGSNATAIQANAVALTTDTTGNYVASITNGAGITGGDGGSEGAALTLVATLGTAIDTSEVTDGTLGFADVDSTQTVAGNPANGASSVWHATTGLLFEGSTSDTIEGLLTAADPTASDKTWTLPNETGTICTTGSVCSGYQASFTPAFTAAGTSGSSQTISNGDTLTIAAGAGITTTGGATDTVTVAATLGTSVDLTTEVTGTLPVANGGTGTASTLTGLVRGNSSAMTAAELSGDVATSGSNATVIQANAVTTGKILDATILCTDTSAAATLAGNLACPASSAWFGALGMIFEGLTPDTNEGLLSAADVTADRTWTLPDVTGTLVTTGDTSTVSATMLASTTVAAGTYISPTVTVDADGRLTAASSNASAAFMFAPMGDSSLYGSAVTAVTVASTGKSCMRFIPDYTLVGATKVAFEVVTGQAGALCSVGIYSDDGLTKLLDSGAKNATAVGLQSTTGLGAVTLSAGTTYKSCYCCGGTTGTVAIRSAVGTNLATMANALTNMNVGTTLGCDAVTGALPATAVTSGSTGVGPVLIKMSAE